LSNSIAEVIVSPSFCMPLPSTGLRPNVEELGDNNCRYEGQNADRDE
jgi:hypothetical protein